MKNVVIGLAGHIDHGKTALAKALTGIDTDRLKEERVRGISIESGFAPYRLPDGQVVSIVDCPGHEKFIKNMLRGISGVDIAILVIAADDGPMPQTREHLDILCLLGIRSGLVVVNKIDLVDRDWLELIHDEIARLIEPTFLRDVKIIDCSCRTGEGIDQLNMALMELVGRVEKTKPHGAFRLPVDRVFSVAGYGTVVTGTLVDGTAKTGAMAMVYPACHKVKIRGIQVHNQWVEEAQAGQRVGFNLSGAGAGVSVSLIKRGDVIALPESLIPSGILDARLHYLKSNTASLANRTRVRLYTGTTELIARPVFMDRNTLQPAEEAIVQFRLEEKVSALVFDRYIIRSLSPQHTIGGGIILDAHPRRYSISEGKSRIDHLDLLEQGKFETFIGEMISGYQFNPCSQSELLRKTGLPLTELHDILARLKSDGVLYCSGEDDDEAFLFARKQAECIKEKILDTLKEFHNQNPLEKGMNKEMLKSKATVGEMDPRLFQHLISDLEARQAIAMEVPAVVRLVTHSQSFSPRQKEIVSRIERAILSNGYRPLKINQLYQMLDDANINQSREVVDRLLKILIDQGVLIRLKADTIIHSQSLNEIKEMIKEYILKKGSMTVIEFRDNLTDVGRTSIIYIMEHLDSVGFTIRTGDTRILRNP